MSKKSFWMVMALLILVVALNACGQSTATTTTQTATATPVSEASETPTAAATATATPAATATPVETIYIVTTPEIVYVTDAPTENTDLIDSNLAAYAGTYTSENGDTLTIDANGNVNISIIRLCSMQGIASGVYKGIMPITATDPNGNLMGLEFNTENKQLYVTDSQWNLLANGDTFVMDR